MTDFPVWSGLTNVGLSPEKTIFSFTPSLNTFVNLSEALLLESWWDDNNGEQIEEGSNLRKKFWSKKMRERELGNGINIG